MRARLLAIAAAAFAFGALLPTVPAGASDAFLTVSPTRGPNGTVVTVSGDCGSTTTSFTVAIEAWSGAFRIDSAFTTAGPAGTFSTTLTMRDPSNPARPAPGTSVGITASCMSYRSGTTALVATFTVPARPRVAVAPAALDAVRGRVAVPVRCLVATCKGKVVLRAGKLVLGSSAYTARPGRAVVAKLVSSKAATKALAKASRKKPIRATLTVTVVGGKTLTKAIRVV